MEAKKTRSPIPKLMPENRNDLLEISSPHISGGDVAKFGLFGAADGADAIAEELGGLLDNGF